MSLFTIPQTTPRVARNPNRPTDPRPVKRGKAHLRWLYETLNDPSRVRGASAEIRREVAGYARSAGESLRASNLMGGLVLARTLAAIIIPTALAFLLHRAGFTALGALLAVVVGAALFGVSSLVHDAAHRSLFASKRANKVLGHMLAPLMLLDFKSFIASHMGHHKHSQSYAYDPKNPRIPRPSLEEGVQALKGPKPGLMGLPLRAWYALARRVLRMPPVARHVFYVLSLFALGLPVVVVFAGDVAFRNRNWRSLSPWLSLAATVAVVSGLFALSSFLGFFYLASLWLAMGFFFGVFLTHITPFQVYPEHENPTVKLMALNVSDIRSGWFVETLGNAFTEYHSAHHLMPAVPSYRLARVGAWLDEKYGHCKAPTLDLTRSNDFNLIGDAIVNSVTRAAGQGLLSDTTTVGNVFRMELMQGASRRDTFVRIGRKRQAAA